MCLSLSLFSHMCVSLSLHTCVSLSVSFSLHNSLLLFSFSLLFSLSLNAQLTYPECQSARALALSLVGELLASCRKNLYRCCVLCVVVWRGTMNPSVCRFKTPPSVPAKRPCHIRHWRFAGTRGGVLNQHTHTHTDQTHTRTRTERTHTQGHNTPKHTERTHTHNTRTRTEWPHTHRATTQHILIGRKQWNRDNSDCRHINHLTPTQGAGDATGEEHEGT